jgi:hypothetical protein
LRSWEYEPWPSLADSSSRYRQAGEHFGDVGVDHLLVCRRGDRYPVVPVFDEVQAADPVDLDRRDRLAASLG